MYSFSESAAVGLRRQRAPDSESLAAVSRSTAAKASGLFLAGAGESRGSGPGGSCGRRTQQPECGLAIMIAAASLRKVMGPGLALCE